MYEQKRVGKEGVGKRIETGLLLPIKYPILSLPQVMIQSLVGFPHSQSKSKPQKRKPRGKVSSLECVRLQMVSSHGQVSSAFYPFFTIPENTTPVTRLNYRDKLKKKKIPETNRR